MAFRVYLHEFENGQKDRQNEIINTFSAMVESAIKVKSYNIRLRHQVVYTKRIV